MNTQTKKIILFTLGGILLVIISSFATVQTILYKNKETANSSVPSPEATTPVIPTPSPAPPLAPPAPPMAQVISVMPHYVSSSKPVKHCYEKPQTVYPQQNNHVPIAGAVIGGVTGGLAGSAIKGKNHSAAIVAGAALGALTGGVVEKHNTQPKPQTVYVTQCSTKTVTSKVQQGYEVTYLYNGVQGMTIMKNPPSSNLIPPPFQVTGTTIMAPAPTAPLTSSTQYQ